jgi:hypothetical protein
MSKVRKAEKLIVFSTCHIMCVIQGVRVWVARVKSDSASRRAGQTVKLAIYLSSESVDHWQ